MAYLNYEPEYIAHANAHNTKGDNRFIQFKRLITGRCWYGTGKVDDAKGVFDGIAIAGWRLKSLKQPVYS